MAAMTFGSLYAGVGGDALGLARAGWSPRWYAERDAWRARVFGRHWPAAEWIGDVGAAASVRDLPEVDLIVADPPSHDPCWYESVFGAVDRARPRALLFRAGLRCGDAFAGAFRRLGYRGVGFDLKVDVEYALWGGRLRRGAGLLIALRDGEDALLSAILDRGVEVVSAPATGPPPGTLVEVVEMLAGFPVGYTCACPPGTGACGETSARLVAVNEAVNPAVAEWAGREIAKLLALARDEKGAAACPS